MHPSLFEFEALWNKKKINGVQGCVEKEGEEKFLGY